MTNLFFLLLIQLDPAPPVLGLLFFSPWLSALQLNTTKASCQFDVGFTVSA
jgi:hypothetical protein